MGYDDIIIYKQYMEYLKMSENLRLIPPNVVSLYGPGILGRALGNMPEIVHIIGRLHGMSNGKVGSAQLIWMAHIFLQSIGEDTFGKLHFLLLFGEDREAAELLFEVAQEEGWIRFTDTQAFYFDDSAILESLGMLCLTDFDIKYNGK